MSTTRSRRADAIATSAQIVLSLLLDRLHAAGVPFKIAVSASKRTGSVYILIRVYDPAGRRLKHSGACVRVSDHRAKRSDRWVNFSRPACRYYGVWFGTPARRAAQKVERIVGGIVSRYDLHRQNAGRQPHTRWSGQPNVAARRPQAVVLGTKGGEA